MSSASTGSAPDSVALDTCGCCLDEPEVPVIHNPPGQTQLNYRIGVHGDFLRRMLYQLHREEIPDGEYEGQRPLEKLTTRALEDPTIALLDAFAVTADVLTFYQERIANEGFLQTAVERRSVLELARAIGYELDPGVAASTWLAFTVEDAVGAPKKATIRPGTQILSIPAKQGQLPQTFETLETFEARAEWNAIRPRLTRRQVLPTTAASLAQVGRIVLQGTSTQLKVGELFLLVPNAGNTTVNAIKRILRIETDSTANRTTLDFEDGNTATSLAEQEVPRTEGKLSLTTVPFNRENVQTLVLNQAWTEENLSTFLTLNAWNGDALLTLIDSLTGATPQDFEGAIAFREKLAFFGHNAPRWDTLGSTEYTRGGDDSTPTDPYPAGWDGGEARSIWTNSQGHIYTSSGADATVDIGADVFLERSVTSLASQSWTVFETRDKSGFIRTPYWVQDTTEASLTDFAISGKTSGLTLRLQDRSTALNDKTDKTSTFKVRRTTAHLRSERLELAELDELLPITAGDLTLQLDGMILGLQQEQTLVLTGERSDAEGIIQSELVTLEAIVHSNAYTTLTFKTGLLFSYKRATVTLNANLVRATHGETVQREVLGSGDGTKIGQSFELKKSLLTYVNNPTTGETESTLSIRINGILWEEASSLYGLDADSRRYIVRIDDDGKATAIFGDGKSGARLPTGRENVVARYRFGSGLDGEVDANSLALLKTRPYGVKKVTNPFAASGAEDPESLDDARTNAPTTVLTLDRVVSIQDFEDFTRIFSGIGKALALDMTRGEIPVVHITIADSDGEVVPSTSDLFVTLRKGIDKVRSPGPDLRIDTFTPSFFNLSAGLKIDEAYDADVVRAAVLERLKTAFSFVKRGFGQPVSAAEVVQMIHQEEGVVAVDIDELYKVDAAGAGSVSLATFLEAAAPRWINTAGAGFTDDIQQAELLLINPYGITLTEMEDE